MHVISISYRLHTLCGQYIKGHIDNVEVSKQHDKGGKNKLAAVL